MVWSTALLVFGVFIASTVGQPQYGTYKGSPVVPAILPGGFLVDDTEVAAAKQYFLDALSKTTTEVKGESPADFYNTRLYQAPQPSYSQSSVIQYQTQPVQTQPAITAFQAQSQPAIPNFQAQSQPATPNFQAQSQPAIPTFQAQSQPAIPSFQAQSQPAIPTFQTQSQPAIPSFQAQSQPALPTFQTQSQPAIPSFQAQSQPAIPSFQAQSQPAIPSFQSQSQPAFPSFQVQSQSAIPSFQAQSQPAIPSFQTQPQPATPAFQSQPQPSTQTFQLEPQRYPQPQPQSQGTSSYGIRTTPIHEGQNYNNGEFRQEVQYQYIESAPKSDSKFNPLILENGYIADTNEVNAARANHYDAVVKALDAVARAQESAKTAGYSFPQYAPGYQTGASVPRPQQSFSEYLAELVNY